MMKIMKVIATTLILMDFTSGSTVVLYAHRDDRTSEPSAPRGAT